MGIGGKGLGSPQQQQPRGAFGSPSVQSPPNTGFQPAAPMALSAVSPTFASNLSRSLLLVSLLLRKGLITKEERGVIKNLLLSRDASVSAAVSVFEIDQDTEELADTWRRIVTLQ